MRLTYYRRLLLIILILAPYSHAKGQNASVKGSVISINKRSFSNTKVWGREYPKDMSSTDITGNFAMLGFKRNTPNFGYHYDRQIMVVADTSKKDTTSFDNGESRTLDMGNGQMVKKQTLTSAVEVVNAKELGKTSVLHPGNALFGKIPGLWVMQNSGQPNQRQPSMYVRGLSTLGSRTMLILVDGFERPLSTIRISQIKSIKVLKDAAAKAMYGQRGANGVVLVTTKDGGDHETRFNFSYERGLTQPKKVPEFVDAMTYAKATNDARFNDGLNAKYSEKEIQYYGSKKYPSLYPNVDWVDEVLGNHGSANNFNFNASGSSDKVRFFLDLSYYGEKGFYKHTNTNSNYTSQIKNDQLNILSKGSMNVSSSTKVKLNLNFMLQNYNHPVHWDVMPNAYSIPSNAFPIKNSDGTWGGSRLYGGNPVAQLQATGYALNNHRYVSLNGQIDQRFDNLLKGLSASVKLGYYNGVDAHENETKQFRYKEVSPNLGPNGNVVDTSETYFGEKTNLSPSRGIASEHTSSNNIKARINYSNTFEDSNFDAVILFHQQERTTGVNNETYRWQNLAGNIHYGLEDTYFLDFTVSYSGSNRIQKSKDRWGLFPAISGSWLISNESFLVNSSSINKLKLKASWGITGNGYIPIQNLTSNRYGWAGEYRFGDDNRYVDGRHQIHLGIPRKTFERSYETNIGLEAKFFDKVKLSGDIFRSKRKNILVDAGGKNSDVIGINTGQRPDGIVKNKGFELNIEWSNHIGDLTYSLAGQISVAESRIINRDEQFYPYSYLRTEGDLVGQMYGWESNGFFQSESDIANSPSQNFGSVKPGDVKYVDQNEDGIINQYDEIAMGDSWLPKKYYSGILNIGYKAVQVSATIQGVRNRSIMLTSDIYRPLKNNANMSTWYTNYWSHDNKEGAKLPRLTTEKNSNNFRNSTVWLRNGNFLKLRYVNISYSLPSSLISRANISKAILYLRGRNLYTFSDFEYADPENINSDYPSIRAYTLGLKVQF